MQDALELRDDARVGGELHDDVVALVLLVDLEGEPTTAPPIDVADLTAAVGDGSGDPVQRRGYDRFVGLRGQDEHDLVLPQCPTSSGLSGPPRKGSRLW